MKRTYALVFTLVIAIVFIFGTTSTLANKANLRGICKSEVRAMKDARKTVRSCMGEWVKSAKKNTDDPSDDCEDPTEEFVDSVKKLKECRKEHLEKMEEQAKEMKEDAKEMKEDASSEEE